METDVYTKAMFGCNAIQVPLNLIVQPVNESNTKVTGIFQGQHPNMAQMMFGSKRTHVLILGDAVIRPRLVIGSDHLTGEGLTSIASFGFDRKWADKGDIILAPSDWEI